MKSSNHEHRPGITVLSAENNLEIAEVSGGAYGLGVLASYLGLRTIEFMAFQCRNWIRASTAEREEFRSTCRSWVRSFTRDTVRLLATGLSTANGIPYWVRQAWGSVETAAAEDEQGTEAYASCSNAS
jgi:hypothetical protein